MNPKRSPANAYDLLIVREMIIRGFFFTSPTQFSPAKSAYASSITIGHGKESAILRISPCDKRVPEGLFGFGR